MPMVDLIASKNFTYGPRRLKKGDAFRAPERDAKVLADWYGKAQRVPRTITNAPRPEQLYHRRDMQAASSADPKPTEAVPFPGAQTAILEDKTRKQLFDIAIAEGVEILASDTKAAMLEKITRARHKT